LMEKRKLHIAIFGNEWSIHTRRWVEGLRGMGHRVDLITMHKDMQHDIGGIDLGIGSGVGYLLKIGRLNKAIKKLSPDIFHTHYASSYGVVASFVAHPRKVLSVWGYDVTDFPHLNFITRHMISKALKSTNEITATSEFLKRVTLDLQNSLPITVIPFGVDLNSFKFVERPNREKIVIGIAKHLHPQYGIDVLIRAFQIIAAERDDVRLIIAGRGTGPEIKEEEYKQLAKDLGLSESIEFVGPIEYSRMPAFLESLDIAAMPSTCDAESFGVAALEAAATGLPVVGTKVGGVSEVIIHNETGFLAENRNHVEIAGYLMTLINDRQLRHKMGLAGRQMVEQRYSWQYCLESMQDLYYKMCS
jgi:L-malate glycosyltransferase